MLCTRCGKLNILKAKYCEVCTPYVRIEELEKLITDALNDNHLSANMTKQPNPTDSYGINARKLWALKQAVEEK